MADADLTSVCRRKFSSNSKPSGHTSLGIPLLRRALGCHCSRRPRTRRCGACRLVCATSPMPSCESERIRRRKVRGPLVRVFLAKVWRALPRPAQAPSPLESPDCDAGWTSARSDFRWRTTNTRRLLQSCRWGYEVCLRRLWSAICKLSN